jgi:G protein-coupled receptor GPR1
MLLIQSDMFKALWFMIFPIVDFSYGPIHSSSTFCQASGFFLAVGIEASDIAALMIALHTALYIFRPRHSGGQNGLYPYRRYAYAIFVIVPLLMASLAFVNQPYGYVNNGQYCYLPVRPTWTRLALSWVPRYFILITIVVTYALIYIYVTVLIRRFGKASAMGRTSASPYPPRNGQPWLHNPSAAMPESPSIVYNGVSTSSTISRKGSAVDRDRQESISTVSTLKIDPTIGKEEHSKPAQPIIRKQAIKWNWSEFGSNSSTADHRDDCAPSDPELASPTTLVGFVVEPVCPPAQTRPAVTGAHGSASSSADSGTNFDESIQKSSWTRRLSSVGSSVRRQSRAMSLPQLIYMLRQGPSHASSASSASSSVFLSGSALDASGMAKTREKIRRQLRLLFVYPLVYMITWLVPFVAHILRWDDPTESGPFVVVLLSLISMCIQGAADSLLFSTREKPWRHMRGKGEAGPNFWPWFGFRNRGLGNTGRTREEMLVDGRLARQRREAEIEETRLERQDGPQDVRSRARQWWDGVEVEGGVEQSANNKDDEPI